jgi:hypothetical protein
MSQARDTGPTRQLRARRTNHLRSCGLTWEQMAEVWIADYPEISPRIAFRWAHNLSHQDVADRWNEFSLGEPTITKARIYEFETWPSGGRRPNASSLGMLARIYQTTARQLLTDDEYTLYDNAARAEIDRIDCRNLDQNQRLGPLGAAGVPASPVTLISRPRITHLVDGKEMLLVGAGVSSIGFNNVPTQLSAFYMDATPVTNEEYWKFTTETNHRLPAHWTHGVFPTELRDHPVVNVSFHDAVSYAGWAGKRLPTALEWEKAARGEEGNVYPWGNRPSVAKCNVRESGISATNPVGKYRSGISPYGMHDMSGNVWEWCATETGPDRHVLKGSAFTSPFEAAQAAAMNDAAADMLDDDTGFRCVCSY